MARLIVPVNWSSQAGGQTNFDMPDGTIHKLLLEFAERFPAIRARMLEGDGRIRRYFNVYLDDEKIPYGDYEATSTDAQSVVMIVPPMAGG